MVKNSPASARDVSSILGQEDPLEKEDSCLENPMDWRSLAVNSPGVAEESDRT